MSTSVNVDEIAISPSKYPQARRDKSIVDEFHGVKVHDPYRWMEDPDAQETKAFVNQLNNISRPFIEGTPLRGKLKDTLTKLWDYEKYGGKTKHGDFYYTSYNTGLQNQSVYYQSKTYKNKGDVFFDVNKFSSDGTTAVSGYSWTDDGELLAIALSEKGSDCARVMFKKKNGEVLKDEVRDIKFSHVKWSPKNDGVLYAKYPNFDTCAKDALVAEQNNHSLFWHKLGTDCKDDVIIAEFPERPKDLLSAFITEDHSLLVISASDNCGDSNRLFFHDLKATNYEITGKLDLKPLFNKDDFVYDFVCPIGDKEALILTNKDAPMSRLIRVKLAVGETDESTWKTVVEEDKKRRLGCVIPFANDKMLVVYLQDAHSVIEVRELESGKFIETLPLPLSTVYSLHTRQKRTELFFSYESFLEPATIVRTDYAKERKQGEPLELEVVHRTKMEGYDPSQFETKQLFYDSKDGTKIPMFLVGRKNVQRDSNNTTILYGYGGFDVPLTPTFSTSLIAFLKHMNGLYVSANLRGGGEYGREWHHAGRMHKKQNVFDDFHAAAEFLIREKYTRPEKLAISGGSNGGLLVAAATQQRPDLYGAAIASVGVLDMLRYHKFTIGAAWMSEFGDPAKKEDFEALMKYSPLHNVKINGQWPAMLLMSADHDDRVVPAHTLKYIAELYFKLNRDAANTQKRPVVARIDVDAGHGAGKPTTKSIEEKADMYAFIYRTLFAEWQD